MKRVAILCLESAAAGTAASQHVQGTKARVEAIEETEIMPIVVAVEDGGVLARVLRVTANLLCLRSLDAAVVRFHPLLLPHVAALRLLGVPILISMQGVPDSVYARNSRRLLLRPVVDWAIKKQASLANCIVVPHIGVSLTSEELYGIKADTVLPNGFVPPSSIDPSVVASTSAIISERDVPFVFFVGAFAAWQGIPTIVEATADPVWPDGVELVIAGHGGLVDDVMRAAESSRKIRYVGSLSPAEVKAYMQHAILTLSVKDRVDETKNGVTPFKVMESITYGTPVLVSALPGQTEIVSETGAGLAVEPGDAAAVAACVRRLVETGNSELAVLKERARAARNDFAWERHSSVLYSALVEAGMA